MNYSSCSPWLLVPPPPLSILPAHGPLHRTVSDVQRGDKSVHTGHGLCVIQLFFILQQIAALGGEESREEVGFEVLRRGAEGTTLLG
jgi:hypothetical protein